MAYLTVTTTTAPHQGAPCWLCRRRDDGVGAFVSDRGGKIKTIWSCLDHIHLLPGAKHMAQKEFDHIENEAVLNGASDKAGKYLDQIGETDLAKLQPHQWYEFLRAAITGFGDDLAERLKFKDGIPF